MSLGSREFLRALRGRARQEVRTRPEWRREARRVFFGKIYRAFNGVLPDYTVRWVVCLGFLGLAVASPPAHLLFLVIMVWAFCLGLIRVGQLQQFCSRRGGALPFTCLPVDSRQIFGMGVSHALRTSLWLLIDVLIAITFTTPSRGFMPELRLGMLPGAVLIWISALATGIILAWRWPRIDYKLLGGGILAVAFVGLLCWQCSGLLTLTGMEHPYQILAWVTPPGWAVQVAAGLGGQTPAIHFLPLGLLIFWLAFAVPCYRSIADRYAFWEREPSIPFSPPPDDAPIVVRTRPENAEELREGEESIRGNEKEEAALPSQVEEIAARARAGEFVRPLTDLPRGWIEHCIFSKLAGQEVLLDYLLATPPRWSRSFHSGLKYLVVASLLGWALSAASPVLAAWVIGLGVFIALGRTAPVFAGSWTGFRLGPMGSRNVALLSVLPVGLREVRKVVLTVNVLRYLLALPIWLACGVVAVLFLDEQSLVDSVRLAAEVWFASLLLQPFFLIFKYSAGTNDTSSGCLTTLVFVFTCLFPFVTVMGVVLAIADGTLPWLVMAFAALAAMSFGLEAAYRAAYNSQLFDLMARSNRG